MNDSLTSIAGLRVGHWTDPAARTGCTVVLCPPQGCVVSGLVLGPAAGTRESALLEPEKTVERAHAVLLAGGSAYGLAAADGVMAWLEEHGRGLQTPFALVPIVPAAVIYDLGVGSATIRPGAEAGRRAVEAAAAAGGDGPVQMGPVGVGTGATVGKLLGYASKKPGGIGSAVMSVRGTRVAALAVSNAAGNIVDPDSGALVAGVPIPAGLDPADMFEGVAGTNTTLVVVATDAPISKADARALAQSAHIGIARVTRPSHTSHDGDTTFVVSTGTGASASVAALSVAAQEVVARALLAGVRAAQTTAGQGDRQERRPRTTR